jgi:hypothetical protein
MLAASVLAAGGCGAQGTPEEAEASLSAGGVPLFKMLLQLNGRLDHFYTTDWNEAMAAQAAGYLQYGPIGKCFTTQVRGSVPLYRLYADPIVDHFYTIDDNEANQAARYGYVREGVACYVFPSNAAGTCPFYRYLFDGKGSPQTDHFYTESAREGALAVQSGYRYEGIAAFLSPYGDSCPQ